MVVGKVIQCLTKQMLDIFKGGQGNPLLDSLTPPGDATGRKAVAGVVCREASSVAALGRIVWVKPTLNQKQ